MKMLQLNRKFGTSLFTEKQMKSFSIILAFCLCIAGNALSQKKLTEATITYDIVINTHDSNPRAADMLDGATSIIYLKGSSSRSEMKSSLGTQATLIDGKSGNVTMLKNYGEQKYMIKFTPQEWAESNKKYENITFSYVNEFKTIYGYNCQKAIGKINDSTSFTVYFTRDLVPINKDFEYMNRSLPGLAMQYESVRKDKVVTYTVSDINYKPIAPSKFELPKSGYRVMTYEESKAGGN
jgi:GLPGLI family protein